MRLREEPRSRIELLLDRLDYLKAAMWFTLALITAFVALSCITFIVHTHFIEIAIAAKAEATAGKEIENNPMIAYYYSAIIYSVLSATFLWKMLKVLPDN